MNSQPTVQQTSPKAPLGARLVELAQLFLKLGTVGFGGPQAHIAMIHDEAVVRRGWLSEDQFLEGVAICEMLPGPASTQTGIYTGYVRAGLLGALVAGTSFIFPAFSIMVVLSWAYFRFQGVPQIDHLFLGISPVVIAIILAFSWKLSQKSIRDKTGVAIALGAFLLAWGLNLNVLLLFLLAGGVGLLAYRPPASPPGSSSAPSTGRHHPAWLVPLWPVGQALPHFLAQVSPEAMAVSSFWGLDRIQTYAWPLASFFVKVGAFIFGGGLVIIPLLEASVVDSFQWMTRSEFLDGVALGELTPGPVVITAAFVGYKVAGFLGALVATVAIFLPSFGFIGLASPFLLRLRQNPRVKCFLRGVLPAVLGAILAATLPLAQAALIQDTWPLTLVAIALSLGALIALVGWKRPTWQLVPLGALVGLAVGAVA